MKIKTVGVCLSVMALMAVGIGAAPQAFAGPKATSTGPGGSSGVRSGGSMTVLAIASQWPGLDPATDTQASSDYDYMNSIYGQLFAPGAHGAVVADEASGHHFSKDGLTLTVGIRHGLKFQDGSPFTAQAVQSSMERDLDPKNACACLSDFAAVSSITTSGPYTLVLHLSSPDYALVDAWADDEAPNWTVSPTALAKEGEQQFSQQPVGAGPFQVVSNTPSQKLVLKAYPGYWEKGRPYLSSLTFLSVGNETSAFEALRSGDAQAVTNIASYQTLDQARKDNQLRVITIPGLHTGVVQLNTTIAPFDNKVAREALYYATNSALYLKVVGGGQGVVTQSPTGPAGLFFTKTVPGYRTYDLKKAQALVKQLGGLTFTYGFVNTPAAATAATALQSMWQQAGISVTLDPETFGALVAGYTNHSWQTSAEFEGSYDPSIGTSGLSIRFSSKGFLSGVKNPALDKLIAQATQIGEPQKRKAIYRHIFKVISDEAYGPYLYSPSGSFVTSKSVAPAHPVTQASFGPLIEWQDIGLAS